MLFRSKKREKQRLEKYLTGLENMSKLPGVVIIIGQPEEIHAVRECRQLGIPTITLLDSNCDPTLADWFIPANDDSVSALRFLLDLFESSILSGQTRYREYQSMKIAKQNAKQSVRRKNSSIAIEKKSLNRVALVHLIFFHKPKKDHKVKKHKLL